MRTFVCVRSSDVGDCASDGVRSTKAAWSRTCLVCHWPTTPRPSTTSTARGCVIEKVKLPMPVALHHPCRSVPTQARTRFRTSPPGPLRGLAAVRNGPKIGPLRCRPLHVARIRNLKSTLRPLQAQTRRLSSVGRETGIEWCCSVWRAVACNFSTARSSYWRPYWRISCIVGQ